MTVAADLRDLRERLPKRSVRLRLTLLYGTLFLASGAALLAINYVLVSRQYTSSFFVSTASGKVGMQGPLDATFPIPGPDLTKSDLIAGARNQSTAALHQLLLQSAIALAIMAVASIWLGWLIAGRALRPLRTITNAARDISASNLHRRLALNGPDDEVRQLANTFDDLLGRLEASFDAQRQFVANASHELRTPLTLERTLVEVALADPDATIDTLRATCERVLGVGEQQERLIEALLTLSRSQRGLDRREPFDLQLIAAEIVEGHCAEVDEKNLRVDAALKPARASGDHRLAERLVANLFDNAARHNTRSGRIEVATTSRGGRAILRVANTGPIIRTEDLERLYEPFQRLDPERNGGQDGLGLGLSIVHAIATAHGADLVTKAQPSGGLEITVAFPPA
ncbi:MAG TPA: ATP-binding protein [Gaiellaceae bacterium]|nr:ATP-binding protein [Gaiellaceae bacterium]